MSTVTDSQYDYGMGDVLAIAYLSRINSHQKFPPTSLEVMQLQLRLIGDTINSQPLETPVVIGRAEDSTFTLQDIWASRHHCEIDAIKDKVVIRDLNSTHGTLVNGEPIEEHQLDPGDQIVIGLTRFTVMWNAANGSVRPNPGPAQLAKDMARADAI